MRISNQRYYPDLVALRWNLLVQQHFAINYSWSTLAISDNVLYYTLPEANQDVISIRPRKSNLCFPCGDVYLRGPCLILRNTPQRQRPSRRVRQVATGPDSLWFFTADKKSGVMEHGGISCRPPFQLSQLGIFSPQGLDLGQQAVPSSSTVGLTANRDCNRLGHTQGLGFLCSSSGIILFRVYSPFWESEHATCVLTVSEHVTRVLIIFLL